MHGSRTFSEGVGVREIIVIAGDGGPRYIFVKFGYWHQNQYIWIWESIKKIHAYRAIWSFSSIFFTYKWGIIITRSIIPFPSSVYVDTVTSGGLRRVGYAGLTWSPVVEAKFHVRVVPYVLTLNFNVISTSPKWATSTTTWN